MTFNKKEEVMAATLVDTVQTTYTQQQLTKSFIEAWFVLYNEAPQKSSIAVLWAQNALETGQAAFMWNNNIGNVKFVANAADTPDIEYCMLKNVWEVINGQKVYFQPPDPATWFRSFRTLKDGVAFQFDFLKNKRYKSAWTAVEAGDPADFSHKLRLQGYYTAPEADYTRAVVGYFNSFMNSSSFEISLQEVLAEQTATPAPVPVTPPPVVTPSPIPETLGFWESLIRIIQLFFGARRN